MASPAKIAHDLPEMLPEDFSDWDCEASPSAIHGNSGGLETATEVGETPEQPWGSVEGTTNMAPLLKGPRDASLSPSPPVCEDFEAFLQNQTLISELVDKLHSRASESPEAGSATNEVPMVPSRLNVAAVDELRKMPESNVTVRREADAAHFVSFPSKIQVTGRQKTASKKWKWMIVAAVSAGSILLLLIFLFPQFNPGIKLLAKQFIQPTPAAADSQLMTNATIQSPSRPLIENNPPAKTETTTSQPIYKEEAMSSPKVQTKLMEDQLAAPTRISQDIKKQVAENAPPPADIGASTRAEGLGGNVNNGVFNGHAQPIIKAAPSKPVAISAGVAGGMLIQKTTPVYPPMAKTARISGTVKLQATISKAGTIENVRILGGPALLQQSAVDAVRTWRYKPYLLNNEPTEIETTINVVFSFGG